MDYALEINDVWKKYRIYHDRTPTLKETMLFRNRTRYEDLWVLKGINLKIEKGKTIGLIGQNGSGKSTLLKLMTRIIYPNQGSIKVNGKVSSLLELGAGFHLDFTGLENIYMNAAILGFGKKEIDRKLKDIIDFSELGKFIDTPVRTYSSGMYMRLAFSIAINVEPEIFLIDEILAVGDQNFQIKCFNKIREFKGKNKTIVIVSHDLTSLEKLCTELVWLENGIIREIGKPSQVIDNYNDSNAERRVSQSQKETATLKVDEETTAVAPEVTNTESSTDNRWGTREIELEEIMLYDKDTQQERRIIKTGDSVTLYLKFKSVKPIEDPVFGFSIYSFDGTCCYGTHTMIDRIKTLDINKGAIVRVDLDNLNLIQGKYWLDIGVAGKDQHQYDYMRRALEFEVVSPILDIGIYRPKHKWQIEYL
ncbi:ABC transporter ATP-binding protein [Desulfotomaculum sp. 1211_IL3151]|uniref:ABC transporter ATP-binding protein n=1 Tax=Desulfotomaculum sp. 1211_IL3151 TaxID=3084055 RepID=UPI002FD8D4CD